jgi:SAM-dependent methyltransferase
MDKENDSEQWCCDDSFWIAFYPYMFCLDGEISCNIENVTDNPFGHKGEIDSIISMVDLDQNSQILDLCCGVGRHSIPFALRGHHVTAVDGSPFLLNIGKHYAENNLILKEKIEWLLEDMRHFNRINTYDIIINMYSSFGYFNDKEDDLKVLKNMYHSLKIDGVLFIETISRETYIIRQDTNTLCTYQTLSNGTSVERNRELSEDETKVYCQWKLLDHTHNSYHSFHTICNVYSKQDLIELLWQVGFSKVEVFGDWLFQEYPLDLPSTMIVVGWK